MLQFKIWVLVGSTLSSETVGKVLSKPKLKQQLNWTEFEVRLHSYPEVHPPTHTNSQLARQADCTKECFKIQKIVLGSIYSEPNSKKKTATLDHIAETYNQLNAKYGKGLYWILAGDTNDLKLDPILHLSPNLKSVVTKPTRLNPDRVLDNIIKDLPKWYQTPECLPPLEADPGSGGKQSDHLIITMTPICTINNTSAKTARVINVRPMNNLVLICLGSG